MDNRHLMLLGSVMPVLIAFATAFMWLGRLDSEVEKLSAVVTPAAFERYGALVREVEGQGKDIRRLERELNRFRDQLDANGRR